MPPGTVVWEKLFEAAPNHCLGGCQAGHDGKGRGGPNDSDYKFAASESNGEGDRQDPPNLIGECLRVC